MKTLTRNHLAYRLGEVGTSLVRLLPPESAHNLILKFLAHGGMRLLMQPDFTQVLSGLSLEVPSIGQVRHPLGLAAGLDKNAEAVQGFAEMGFSFLEVGTVTPKPQPGNPKPRLFRLPSQLGLINRMGFNNEGATSVLRRLQAQSLDHQQIALGVNLGKNKDTPNEMALDDYIAGIKIFGELARYLVINLSSPNTEGLRSLAGESFIHELAWAAPEFKSKMWIKLDPDMDRRQFQKVIETIADEGFCGVVLTNTHKVLQPQVGGLSGHALSALSNARLEWAYAVHKGRLAMIASGGVLTGLDVLEKIVRGAVGVQIYTALIYRGPWAVYALLNELSEELKLRGIRKLSEVVASYYNE